MKISDWKKLDSIHHYRQEAGRHPGGTIIPPFFERVELMTGGRGWIWHEERWREVRPGDLIWNRPGDRTIGRSDFENPYRCLAVTLVSQKKDGAGMPRFSVWPNLEEVNAFVQECTRLFLDEGFDRRTLFDYVAGQLVFRVQLHKHEEDRRDLPPPLRGILRQMERDYASSCRLEELAASAGWSVAHLHEMFRRHLQIPPHQMVMRVRLRAVRERLASTNQPLKQIALECGFFDSAALAHAFRTATGLTPGKYRERCRRVVMP